MRLVVNGGATAFATGDTDGQAVSCVATMNTAMGTGRIADGTGVILAPNVDPNEFDISYSTPVMVVNTNTYQVHIAGGGSGGTPDATESVRVIADVFLGRHLLSDSISVPRIFHSGQPSVIFMEPDVDADLISELESFGQTVPVQFFGRINMISCPGGMKSNPEDCSLYKDSRGFGLSTADVF